MTLFLGIDIGTSGVRTAVIEEDRVVAKAKTNHLPQSLDNIDARKWWDAVLICMQMQMAELKRLGLRPAQIKCIAVAGTSGSMLLTDKMVEPVSPALMYNSVGFFKEAELIAQYAPAEHITLGSNSALGRAIHLANRASAKPCYLMHQADFIAAKLMGRGGFCDENNALKTGFDPATGRWPDWIGNVFEPTWLPKVTRVGEPWGRVDSGIAKQLELSASLEVCAGTTDSTAAFLACAPLKNGTAVTSLGSTLAIKHLSEQRIDDQKIGLYSHKIGDLWLVGGASNTGGAVLANFFDQEEIVELCEQMDPDQPTGLNYYPLLEPGERFPINDPTLKPNIKPRPESDVYFLQGMLEAIASIEARCYREIEARGGGYPKRVFSAGGGAQNQVFAKIRSKALGTAPLVSSENEAAVGAARIAAGLAGLSNQ